MDMRLLVVLGLSGVAASTAVAIDATLPAQWHGPTEIAVGRGEKGPWHQNDSRYDYVDDPTVAVSDAGDLYVAWVEQGRKDVLFQRFAAGGDEPLGEPVNVSRSPATFSWLPRIAVTPRGHVLLLWQEIIFSGGSHGGDMLFARSTDGGRSFAEPINLSRSIGGDGKGRITRDVWHNGSFDIAAHGDVAVYATWTEYDGALWFARSTDGGKSFAAASRVAAGDKPARGPALALGTDGVIHLAWTHGDDDGADIQYASSSDRGATFSAPRVPASSKGYSDAPKLAVDSRGTLHLVYTESAGGPFGHYYQVRYTRSRDGGRSFEAARAISGSTSERAGAGYPSLDVDDRGNVYVLWERYPDRWSGPRGLVLAVSRDGGDRFSAPMLVPGSVDPAGGINGSQQGRLMRKLAVNDSGAIAIVNSALKHSEHSRVWLIRGALVSPAR